MLEETGRIVALDQEKNLVWIETARQTACQSCSARKGCGQRLLNASGQQLSHHIRAISQMPLAVGDQVVVAVPESLIVKGALLVYLLPLLLLIVGAGFGSAVLGSDLASVLSGLLGLAIGFLIVRLHSLRVRNNPSYQPHIIRQLYTEPVEESPVCLVNSADS